MGCAGFCKNETVQTVDTGLKWASGTTAVLATVTALFVLSIIANGYLLSWIGVTTSVSPLGVANCLMVAKWAGIAAGAGASLWTLLFAPDALEACSELVGC